MNFKNMKIPVENNLDEIVATLESKGYYGNIGASRNILLTSEFGKYFTVEYCTNDLYVETTLAKLKEM